VLQCDAVVAVGALDKKSGEGIRFEGKEGFMLLQIVAVCCSVLQLVHWIKEWWGHEIREYRGLYADVVHCNVLQCVAVGALE